jgi:hypothetical protein
MDIATYKLCQWLTCSESLNAIKTINSENERYFKYKVEYSHPGIKKICGHFLENELDGLDENQWWYPLLKP